MKIALLGAECTGKTRLSVEMARQLETQGLIVRVVPEVLRQWCQRECRTPLHNEQHAIAREQAHRVNSIAACDIVICDTTPLMTAIYSEALFNDRSIFGFALEHHAVYDMTLVMGLDLPWIADGHQRDGPHSQEPIDALLRNTLGSAAIPYVTVYGQHANRCENALTILSSFKKTTLATPSHQIRNQRITETSRVWRCDKCDDASCEHHIFQELIPPLTEVAGCRASDGLGQ